MKIFHNSLGQIATSLALAAVLAGCGGGNTTATGSTTTPFSTNAPATLNLAVGQSQSFVATGGGDGNNYTTYSISDTTPSVDNVSISSANFTIKALKAGTDTVTISDAAGDKQTVAVVVTASGSGTSSTTVSVAAPATVNLTQGQPVTYPITGGTGVYSAVSGTPSVASTQVNNSSGTVTINPLKAGPAIIYVYDTTLTTPFQITVNVTSASGTAPLLTTAPAGSTLAVGTKAVFGIFAGTPPYSITSTIPAIATGTITNTNTLTVNALSVGGPALLTITDAALNQTSFEISVGSTASTIPLKVAAPDSITVGLGSPQAVSYPIIGGIPPYTVATGNDDVATATLTTPTTITITGEAAGQSTEGIVFDSQGNSQSFTIAVGSSAVTQPLVASSGSAITIAVNASATYTIQGGTPLYTVTSSNAASATVTSSGSSFTVKGVASGTGTIVILDSAGTIYNVSFTVP